MIFVGFDPESNSVVLDVIGMPMALELPIDTVIVKYFGDSGVAVATLNRGGIELEFVPLPDEPAFIHVRSIAPWTWHVNLNHPGTAGPGQG